MKLKTTISFLLISMVLSSCSSSKNKESESKSSKDFKMYGVESGIIEYKIEGPTTGTETLYFDNWGRKEVKYTNAKMKMGDFVRKINTIVITDDQWSILIDLDTKTGQKMKNEPDFSDIPEGGLYYSESYFINQGGKKVGSEEVGGKLCDVWLWENAQNSKTWIWKGIQLKAEMYDNDGKVGSRTTAISVQEAKVPEETFTVPAGVTITETTEP